MTRRCYDYCAKCGKSKDHDQNYVHDSCLAYQPHRRRPFRFCAVDGEMLTTDGRDYVCSQHLVTRPAGRTA